MPSSNAPPDVLPDAHPNARPNAHPEPTAPEAKQQPMKPANERDRLRRDHLRRDLLHYAAYFAGVGSIVFIAQTGEAKQVETSLLAGAIAGGAVISRDWYKARLAPDMAADPSALIQLFSEMLHAGRAQANTNTAQLKRVEFLQSDLIDAMRQFNELLRLSPAEVEQSLRAVQTQNLTQALSALDPPLPASAASTTHTPDSTTVRQTAVHLPQQNTAAHRVGFDQ